MPCDGNEYLDSLINHIKRTNPDKKEMKNPEYLRRVEIAKKVVVALDENYNEARNLILDTMINGGYETATLAFGPCLISSSKERRADVEKAVDDITKFYKAFLKQIDDYGTGKSNVKPDLNIIFDESEEPDSKLLKNPENDFNHNYQ